MVERSSPNLLGIQVLSILSFIIAIITPSLPLRFSLKSAAIAVLFVVFLTFIVFKILEFKPSNISRNSKYYVLEISLYVFICFLLLQLTPLPTEFIRSLSPSMAEIWSYTNAYNLKGRAALTADITSTIWYLITWLSYILIFIMIIRYITKPWQFVFIILSIFLLGIYQITFDVVSKYFGFNYISSTDTDGHHYRITGTFINSNHTSALINLSIASGGALVLYFIQNLKLHQTVYKVVAVLLVLLGELFLLYGSIKAGSVGGFLSLLVSVGFVMMIFLFKRFTWKRLLILLVFVFLTVCLLIIFGGRELNVAGVAEKISLSGRPLLWHNTLQMWMDFPLFGVGAGSYEWTFPLYQSEHIENLRVFTAHNDYLQILVELGMVGFAILTIFLITYFVLVFITLKNDGQQSNLTLILMVGVVAFLIQEVVETSFIIPAVSVVFFSLMGLALAVSNINFD